MFPRDSTHYLEKIVKMIVANRRRSQEVRHGKKPKDKTVVVNV